MSSQVDSDSRAESELSQTESQQLESEVGIVFFLKKTKTIVVIEYSNHYSFRV